MISKSVDNRLESATYLFGEFSLEAENLLLLRNAEVVSLAPKTVEVLLTLIRADGKLITKQEILDAVWAETFVEEANLTHHISALRKALGEDKSGRKFIETIPRRGYRFIAPVNEKSGVTEIVITEKLTARSVEETAIETESVFETIQTNKSELPESSVRKSPRKNVFFDFGGIARRGIIDFIDDFRRRTFFLSPGK